ncbi:MAG: MFS transporter, partial [Vagococcus sp.]|nr:MFS transporter [Vagococcus sp.]
MSEETMKKYRYLLMLGHMFTDINQGALPAIIPFLIASQGLSYASAASLVLAANLVSSFVQPFIGYLGDKKSRPWFMSVGIFLAGLGVALLGFSPSFFVSCLLASLSGIGVAMFHPEGGKIANYVAGSKKGSGMSIFAVGGNLGFAIGPIITSIALSIWGIKGSIVLIIPATIMSFVMFYFNQKLTDISVTKKSNHGSSENKEVEKD